jgi:DNA ligase D-like protein (predicted polymerase)
MLTARPVDGGQHAAAAMEKVDNLSTKKICPRRLIEPRPGNDRCGPLEILKYFRHHPVPRLSCSGHMRRLCSASGTSIDTPTREPLVVHWWFPGGGPGTGAGTVASVAKAPAIEVEVGGRTVRISNPERVYFPVTGATKLDLVNYYLAVGPGIVTALRERPCMMHRFPGGVSGDKVHQKRVPAGAPPWIETVRVHFPRYGLHADELCVTELAHVIWAVQMSTVEFHPWNSRRSDTERPDEWRIDLDPMPDCPLDTVRRVAHVVHEVLDELGAVGWPKTSGGKGLHVYVRIKPSFGFADVRRAALAFAREVERRTPDAVTTAWWRKDRDPSSLFVDYNQNARDHTMAAAYSVRGVPEATVSTPITWDEIDAVEPYDCTIHTVPQRFSELGDLHSGIDQAVFAIDELLEWATRDEWAGAVDPPPVEDPPPTAPS